MSPQAALFYPFPNLLELGSGNSLRASLLIAYLAERCERLTTVSPGSRNTASADGVISHRQVAAPRWRQAAGKWTLRGTRVLRGTDAAFARSVLARFDEPAALREFDAATDDALDGADVAFVEYPFWVPHLAPKCRERGVPLVLSLYDIHGQAHEAGSRAASTIAARELDAIRLADEVFCVSTEDQGYLAERGIAARLAINPIDVASCRPPRPDEGRAFRDRHRFGNGPIAMFVGSRIVPNVEAADALVRVADEIPDCTFVIAGRCAPPGRRDNVVRLGWLSAADLDALYAASDLVVMPLSSGTGTSLKFVEALAYGKAIVATEVAARGYEAVAGVHAHVVSDVHGIAAGVRRVAGDGAYRAALGNGARTLATRYDFHTVFEPYGALLERGRRL